MRVGEPVPASSRSSIPGIDPDHPLLQGVLVPGYDFVNDTRHGASEWNDLDHATVEILDHATVEILDSAAAPGSAESSRPSRS